MGCPGHSGCRRSQGRQRWAEGAAARGWEEHQCRPFWIFARRCLVVVKDRVFLGRYNVDDAKRSRVRGRSTEVPDVTGVRRVRILATGSGARLDQVEKAVADAQQRDPRINREENALAKRRETRISSRAGRAARRS